MQHHLYFLKVKAAVSNTHGTGQKRHTSDAVHLTLGDAFKYFLLPRREYIIFLVLNIQLPG